jgi:predicted Fe-Mo cluster-binding NifX family protein
MKVAIATDDFKTVTGHVGRCEGFLIVEVENGEVNSIEERANNFTNHRLNGGHRHHDHSGAHRHGHARLAEGLKDCEYLICSAAGKRLINDLNSNGIVVIFTDELIGSDAAKKLSTNDLNILESSGCGHH